MKPPIAKAVPHELEKHGHVRVDNYYWLRDLEDPEVLAYLEAENAYTEAVTAASADLRETLYQEIRGRIPEEDESVPYRRDDYYYYLRYEEGREYAVHCRRHGSLDAPEEILLDVNLLAREHEYLSVPRLAVNDPHDVLAYAMDTRGSRVYTIRFKDLKTGELLPDTIRGVTSNIAWAADGKTIFYNRQQETTLRPFRIWRHVLGTDTSEDVLVYQEDDATFRTYVYRTKSRKYLLIASEQTVSSEFYVLPADDPAGEFRLFRARQRGHEYDVDHLGEHFYVRTNAGGASNFKLMRCAIPPRSPQGDGAASSHEDMDAWEEVVPHRDDVLLEGFELFRGHLVTQERRDALSRLVVRPWDGEPHEIAFDEPAHRVEPSINVDVDTEVLRIRYTSLSTPWTTYDVNLRTGERVMLKRDRVLGAFDPADYHSDRLWATAPDGVRVPISLVYRRDKVRPDSKNGSPLLLYGYGAYGSSRDVSFSASLLSLLDRGFAFAIAHVRGGEEMGRAWYDGGRLKNKVNTFTDFIACGEHLVAEGWADPQRLYARGGSAGGLLLGAVMNLRPDLFQGMLVGVPFVDVLTTMLDDSIPLTTGEYDEWGNPNDKDDYETILAYSPYDNVEAKDYPPTLVTTGINDSQVHYWEPAKWVAKLRALKTDDNVLLLKVNMGAGHLGASGRYGRYREIAFEYAFVLDLASRS